MDYSFLELPPSKGVIDRSLNFTNKGERSIMKKMIMAIFGLVFLAGTLLVGSVSSVSAASPRLQNDNDSDKHMMKRHHRKHRRHHRRHHHHEMMKDKDKNK
jgi:Ni/Co efflux regulator RcnB